MDESLFVKHLIQIKKQKTAKEEILTYIKEQTGIELQETMIALVKKNITFHVSSVTKQKLHQKNIAKILMEKGYLTKF